MEEWDAYLAVGQKERCMSTDFLGLDAAGDASQRTTRGSGSVVSGLDDIFAPSPVAASPVAASPVGGFFDGNPKGNKHKSLADLRAEQKGGDDLFIQATGQQEALGPNLMMQQLMNHYELLGLTEHASLEDIRAAYKSKSLRLHPDRNPNLHDDDKQMFKLITKAHEVLSDSTQRQQYDMSLHMKSQPAAPTQGGNWLYHLGGGVPGGGGPPPPQQYAAPYAQQQPMGGMNMGGPMGGGSSPPQQSAYSAPPKAGKPADPFSGLF